jgi:hypothetical protein
MATPNSFLRSREKPPIDGWKFDGVHNHWKKGPWLIAVQFNPAGTRHLFHIIRKGYSYGSYDLESVADAEVGFFKTLGAAKVYCDSQE